MAIITISRELAALGDETAQELVKEFGYKLVDKSVLEERMKSYGISSRKFQKYDEKKPSFLASLSSDRDDYLHFLKSAVLAEAEQGNAVFIGRGAAEILRSVPSLFSVFLAASNEIRQERGKSYFHCDDKRASQIILQSDNDREGFYRFFFDIDWKDAGNYHLALNTGCFDAELCAKTIAFIQGKSMDKETDSQGAKRIQEITLGQRIKHHILYEKEISIHFLEASVSENQVFLYGVANTQPLVDAAVSFAKELAPDFSIQSEIQVVKDYSILP